MITRHLALVTGHKFIQDKLNSGETWSRLVMSTTVKLLAPMRYYKSKSQYFPTENIPHLDADTSQLDMSSRGKYSVPIKNLEIVGGGGGGEEHAT